MRTSSKHFHIHIISCIAIFLFLFNPEITSAQRSSNETEPPDNVTTLANDDQDATLRWKIFLDSVAQESRTSFPEERRVYPTVESANAYWEFDPHKAKSLYIAALDTAISITKQDNKNRPTINYILSSAAKRDPGLAKELSERLLESDLKGGNDAAMSTAMDLVESDPEAAARLAEAFAPNGLEYGNAMNLIFRIGEKNIGLSDRVYGVYLRRVAAQPTIPLNFVLCLGGYSFGYSEHFSINGNGNISGATHLPLGSHRANLAFINAFLSIAYQRALATIERRNQATGDEIAALNYQIIFTFEYLMPEVARFSPNSLIVWQQLQQQGMAGTTSEQVQTVRSAIQLIQTARTRIRNYTDSSQTPETQAEASLKDVEKLPGTCQRDVVYSEAALVFSARKNFTRALEINEKIEDLKQREAVNQAISIGMAEEAIENNSPDVRKMIEKIASSEQRAILLVSLANGINDLDPVAEAVKIANGLPNTADTAGILFSLSAISLRSDTVQAQTLFSNGVKYLNRSPVTDTPQFSIELKVPLGCNGEDKWYGGSSTLPYSNVFDAIGEFAKRDPDTAATLVREIADKTTKLRAQALTAKIALNGLYLKKKH